MRGRASQWTQTAYEDEKQLGAVVRAMSMQRECSRSWKRKSRMRTDWAKKPTEEAARAFPAETEQAPMRANHWWRQKRMKRCENGELDRQRQQRKKKAEQERKR